MLETCIMSAAAIGFGNKLRELRTHRGWSQQQLASCIGMGIAQINRYERGTSQPTLEVIRKIALEFRISADELVFQDVRGLARPHLKSKLLQRFEKVGHFPRQDQEVILYLLDAVIARVEFARTFEDRPAKVKTG